LNRLLQHLYKVSRLIRFRCTALGTAPVNGPPVELSSDQINRSSHFNGGGDNSTKISLRRGRQSLGGTAACRRAPTGSVVLARRLAERMRVCVGTAVMRAHDLVLRRLCSGPGDPVEQVSILQQRLMFSWLPACRLFFCFTACRLSGFCFQVQVHVHVQLPDDVAKQRDAR